ncbi:MAG: GNAT family N-acetyltransferase [Flavobacteriales bacterium]|nr:GNAT family N-acetyltransferase [Flavobacteriales bacterium]
MTIRNISPEDAIGILNIYAPYVLNSAITFEYDVPSVDEMKNRILHYTEKYPWLVAEDEGKIIGYAYASTYRERTAYQWCCESSVYVSEDVKGKGLAHLLYDRLFELLTAQGICNVYGIITLPNPVSEKFHSKCGFESFAVFKNVGYKLEAWHDVLWMVRFLNEHNSAPRLVK